MTYVSCTTCGAVKELRNLELQSGKYTTTQCVGLCREQTEHRKVTL